MDGLRNAHVFLTLVTCYVLLKCACAQSCGVITGNNGSMYPKYPLSWGDFHAQVFRGGMESPVYHEIYSLHPLEIPPELRKVVIRWERQGGIYLNKYSGAVKGIDYCYPDDPPGIILFNRTSERKKVQFEFDIVLPEPVRHVGTMFSSCPSEYLLSWYCPKEYLDTHILDKTKYKTCRYGTRISLLTSQERPDHLPWESIVRDLCKNGSPPMADKRWVFVWEGIQCPIDDSNQNNRKRRSAETPTLKMSPWP